MNVADIFKPFTDRLNDFLGGITQLWDELTQQIGDVLTLKSIVSDELNQLVDEFQEFTQDQADFVERAKNLQTHVIRADLVFKLIDEIRTGELKQFVTDALLPFQNELTSSVNDLESLFSSLTARGSGPLTTSSVASKLISVVQKIKTVWLILARVIFLIKSIEPFLKKLLDKLKELESIVMPQTSKRTKQTETYFKRG